MTFNTKLEGRSAACATIAHKKNLQNHLKGNKMKSRWITTSSPIPLYELEFCLLFAWVWNFVPHTEGGIQAEGVQE